MLGEKGRRGQSLQVAAQFGGEVLQYFGNLPALSRIQLVWDEGMLATNQYSKSYRIMSFPNSDN